MNEIKSHCILFFEQLFGGHQIPQTMDQVNHIRQLTKFKCSAESKALLQAPFSAAKIKREALDLPKNKTPGPDGFSGEFFKKTWEIIGHELIEAVSELN